MKRPFLVASSTVLMAFLLAGCGNKEGTSASGSAAAETAGAGSGSASAKPEAAAPPTDADATVVAELKKVATCKREDGNRVRDCEAEAAWDKFRETLLEEDDLNLTKQKKLTKACFALVGDANENIRESAYDCLSTYSEGVDKPKAVITVILDKLEAETSDAVRSSMLSALDELDPTKNGGADRVLALAKKLEDQDSASSTVSSLIGALTPEKKGDEPPKEAFAYGVELIGKKKFIYDATGLVASSKANAPEGCKALLGLVETKKSPWSKGIDAMANVEGGCKEQHDKVIEIVVGKAGEGEGYDKGLSGADLIYVQRLVDKGGFTAEQKKKLKDAVEPLAKAEKDENKKKSYDSFLNDVK